MFWILTKISNANGPNLPINGMNSATLIPAIPYSWLQTHKTTSQLKCFLLTKLKKFTLSEHRSTGFITP